jgi:uncharacterized LabA/DUF88 family protein
MAFIDNERTALFIDGANLYSTTTSLRFKIDYKLLLNFFSSKANLVRALYYTAIIESQPNSPVKSLADWLEYNGFTVVTKPAKIFTDESGISRTKGNMDVELAMDAIRLADYLDHIVIFSGDSDFKSLVEAIQSKGVKVTVVSTMHSKPPMIGDELRRQADAFIDLRDLQPLISAYENKG